MYAFEGGGVIPAKYTCDGENISPQLSITGVPAGIQSLVLIVDDHDVPKQILPEGVFDHWVLFDIPPAIAAIPEGGSVGTEGAHGRGKKGYTGPCPPREYEPKEHRYVFTLYALDTKLDLPAGASKMQVVAASEGHVLGEAQLIGRYERKE
jgi:Raf kinase inhibitor-like YbhB/YbcL family protein